MFKLAAFAALVAVCAANDPYPDPAYPAPAPYKPAPAYKPAPYKPAPYKAASYDNYDAPAYYSFDWAVKDDYYNNYGQQETRNGDKTDGSYSVLLPDGRVQTVKYYVDGYSGYVADVSYSGEPKYEASYKKPVYAPAPYKAAPYKPAYKPAPYAPAPYAPAPYAPAPYAPAPYDA